MHYTANSVNQYSAITHAGIAEVLGYSPDSGTITATPNQLGSTTIQCNHWRAEISESNTATGKWSNVQVEQEDNGTPATIGQGKLWTPPATASPT